MKTQVYVWRMVAVVCCLLCLPATGLARKKVKKNTETAKTETAYERLFKDSANVQCAQGWMNLYWVKEKVYLEVPQEVLEKPFLMGAVVEGMSNMQESSVGFRPADPVAVSWVRADSVLRLYRQVKQPLLERAGGTERTSRRSFAEVLLEQFPIQAYSPDSALVIELTSLLLRDEAALNPLDPKGFNHMDGWIKRKPTFKKERSAVAGIQAIDRQLSVACLMSYDLSVSLFGVFPVADHLPFTALVKRVFLQLPESDYRPRVADVRVGTQYTGQRIFGAYEQGSREEHWVNRWHLEPGQQLVFYVDTLLPERWKRCVERSVAPWNAAFNELGYGEVLVLKPYPKKTEGFDANSLAHSCIRYVTSPAGEITHQLWSSPFTGEILSANLFLPHNLAAKLQRNYFLQTAAFYPKARTLVPDEALVEEALTSQLLKQWGYCLGLCDNMAGSRAYAVDSLRSAAFVERHGLSASVMDVLPLNFLLDTSCFVSERQLTQQVLGPYDRWALRYLYQRFPGATPETEQEALRKLAQERDGCPELLYKQVQSKKAYYDPRGMEMDLGPDAVRAASIAFDNLARVIAQADGWLDRDDPDYALRLELYGHLINQTDEYVKQVLQQVGGLYLNDHRQGEKIPSYQAVEREVQRRSLCWMLEAIEKMGWMDAPDLLAHTGLVGSAADYAQKFFGNLVLIQLNHLWLSEGKTDNPYTQQQAVDDVMQFLWKDSRAGKTPSSLKRFLQLQLLNQAIALSNVEANRREKKGAKQWGETIPYQSAPDRDAFWYGVLMQIQSACREAQRVAPSRTLKEETAYQLFLIERAMRK